MARLARVVAPGHPHHITQRGNRRQDVFFEEADYLAYCDLMGEWCAKRAVQVWAYCLMPNHVHLIAVPETEDGLRRAVGEAYRRYSRRINFANQWTGYLWQGRFASFPMDEKHLIAAARYVELNPVRAGLARSAEDYPWSSARAHMAGRDDVLVHAAPLLERVGDWRVFLAAEGKGDISGAIGKHIGTGRPLGSDGFVTALEKRLDRPLKPRPAGRKRKRA